MRNWTYLRRGGGQENGKFDKEILYNHSNNNLYIVNIGTYNIISKFNKTIFFVNVIQFFRRFGNKKYLKLCLFII